MVWNLEQLYTDTMTLFVTHSLMEGKIDDTQKIYEKVRVRDEKTCSMRGTGQIPFTILIVAGFYWGHTKTENETGMRPFHRTDSVAARGQIRRGRSLFGSC